MESMEYRTIDKSEWGRGEWLNEPDKMQFVDEATGLPCLIVRNSGGALCGYVGVAEGHPFFGKGYSDNASVEHVCDESCDAEGGYHSYSSTVGGHLSAHGGITFAAFCSSHDEATYAKFLERMEKRRHEAQKFPKGDAARLLKEWGGLKDIESWRARCEAVGVCHIPGADEPARVWWFGFDCAHSGDASPAYDHKYGFGSDGWYKNIRYVKQEIAGLARQLAQIGS